MHTEPIILTPAQVQLLSAVEISMIQDDAAAKQRAADLAEFRTLFCQHILREHGIEGGKYNLDLGQKLLIPNGG